MDVSRPGIRLDGWITPRLERVLRRAAEYSSQQGYNYLAVEHVVLAVLEDSSSVPMHAWHGALTASQWQDSVLAAMPEVPTDDVARPGPVVVSPLSE